MKRIIALFVVVFLISVSFLNCSDDKTTNPGTEDDDYDLITVPGTSGYLMGWDGIMLSEEPVHSVALDEFHIGEYEVTYALWTEVKTWAESNGYTFANNGRQGSDKGTSNVQHPVTVISWRDCIAWCNAYSEYKDLDTVYYTTLTHTTAYRNSLSGGDIDNDCVDWDADGFRLPTEAEWEYAARYVDGSSVSSGAEHSGYNLHADIDDCVWHSGNSDDRTHMVGQLQANSLGAKDMNGNVWEICWDWYAVYSNSSQDNPLGPDSGDDRIVRGASWNNAAADCRTARRWAGAPEANANYVGFRVCRGGSAN